MGRTLLPGQTRWGSQTTPASQLRTRLPSLVSWPQAALLRLAEVRMTQARLVWSGLGRVYSLMWGMARVRPLAPARQWCS